MSAGTHSNVPPNVPPIESARTTLITISPEIAAALLEGDHARAEARLGRRLPEGWSAAIEPLLRLRLAQMRRDPSLQQWLARAMVLRDPEQTVIGHIGFHGPPRSRGEVEVGYTVLPAYRRRGYATEAVLALFDWAATKHGVTRFVASVSPTNGPSLGLVMKLGFVQVGRQWDEEDGEELVFELVREAPGRA